jgi:hypothetical protein
MKNILRLSSLLILVLIAHGLGQATDGTLGTIITPTGNIYCEVYRLSTSINPALNGTGLTCEVAQSTAPIPPRAKDCEFDWGYRFGMGERGKAERACYSDVLFRPKMTRLEYGQTRKIAGFTCDLTKTRLRCVNLDKRGFELSKATQKLF